MERITNENPESKSADIVAENIEKASLALKEHFPEIVTESDGKKKIDFEALKEILGEAVEDKEERYNFTWHGKSKARQLAQAQSAGTLRPCKEKSVDWDTTGNLFIEGDNLEVLKLLQKSYHKKVKMIYIDPPYNTGKEFIYPDKYQDNLDTYLRYTGQKDGDGFKISSNTESSGRYHTNWLNMMYPRLKLARNLLTDDGVIFISIDDNEQVNLKKMCDENFGEENFVAQFVVQTNPRGRSLDRYIAKTFEYIICYSKVFGSDCLFSIPKGKKALKEYNKIDENGKYRLLELRNRNPVFNRGNRPNLYYPIYVEPKTGAVSLESSDKFNAVALPLNSENEDGCWTWGTEKVRNENGLLFGKKVSTGKWRVYRKDYIPADGATTKEKSLWLESNINHENGKEQIGKLFETSGNKTPFDFPKSVELIKKCVNITTKKGGVVLDFFSGSSTTAHAVLDLNKVDNGNRKFIMVQLPEPCDEESEAYKAGYKTIAEIGKERIRRAASKIKKEHPEYQGDLGFKVFKLASSNIKPWDANYDTLEDDLLSSVESLKPDRSAEDILHEILLKYGLELNVPVAEHSIAGKTVFEVGVGELLVCLEDGISLEVAEGIGALAKNLSPEIVRVVFKDSGFADDVVKTNTMQVLKQFGIDDVKSI
jgi:adenine-specific DNA-methyltransferase